MLGEFLFFFEFAILFFYCCSITIVPIFPPLLSPAQPSPTFHIQSSLPLSLSMGPLYMFLDLTFSLLSSIIPLPFPLWSLIFNNGYI